MDTWDGYKQKLRELLTSEYRTSVMNTTKWEEIKCLMGDLRLRYRVKLITDNEPLQWCSGMSHEPLGFVEAHGPVRVLEVEWMEIDSLYRVPRPYVGLDRYEDRAVELEQGLETIGAPYTYEDRIYRVWGHVPKDQYPDFIQQSR